MNAPAGWYANPTNAQATRWWDGQQWTDATAAIAQPRDWRTWITTSRAAGRIGVVIAVLALIAVGICVVIIVLDLIRQRAVPGVPVLLIAGIPLIAVGQLWAIGLMQARRPPSAGLRKRSLFTRSATRGNPMTLLFGPLAPRIAWTLMALAFLGWLAAGTAVPWIAGGSPADAANGCAYRLANHGTYSCVSRSAYEQAGAGVQRFATGILLAFYSLHAGAALGGLQQRSSDS